MSGATFTRVELAGAADVVHASFGPTPCQTWPLLDEEVGAQVWVKHENHTPIGSFKVRGGLVLVDRLAGRGDGPLVLVSATRGNHGQSLAYAGRRFGVAVHVFVPEGNNPEKDAAIRALGARVSVVGRDFDDAVLAARDEANRLGATFVPSFGPELVLGVATYADEMFAVAPMLDTVYVPIGLGSGICGALAVRDLVSPGTEVVGVVAAGAPTYAQSFAARAPVPTRSADTIADGLAVRHPHRHALAAILDGVARIVVVDDDEVRDAMRRILRTTHNLVEPAGAAAVAALWQERDRQAGRRVGVVFSGANVDAPTLAAVLAPAPPAAGQ